MSTRGVWGFYHNGTTKATYNHFDSYPTVLGEAVRQFVKANTDMQAIFDRIIMVSRNAKPTGKQIRECAAYLDTNVHKRTQNDWYCLLRKSQGKPDCYADGLRYMMDSQTFLQDSVWCEWGYIINLDDGVVEVYRGFQKTRDDNRYALDAPDDSGYWHCKLQRRIPLALFARTDMDWLEKSIEEEMSEKESTDSQR